MWTRRVNVDARWECRSSLGFISKPHLVSVRIIDTYTNRPTESLDEWAYRVANEVTNKMCIRACQSLSDSVFCDNIFPDIGTPSEEGKAPVTVTDYIKEVERYIRDSKDDIRDMEDRIADILVTPADKRTSSQKDEIRRLDNEIRKENEFIREYESEIRKLKIQYGID